jgi:orotate phosphoribosyltransferase
MPIEIVAVEPIKDADRVNALVSATRHVPSKTDLVRRLISSNALLEGHFKLLSGLHSDVFLRFRNFVADEDNLEWATQLISTAVRQGTQRFDAIVSPDSAGSLLAIEVAESFGRDGRVLPLRTNAANEPTEVFVAASTRSTDRVLLINDILTTGNGVRVMRRAVEDTGAQVIALALFATRVPDPAAVLDNPSFPIVWLLTLDVEQWTLAQCRQCNAGKTEIVDARVLN